MLQQQRTVKAPRQVKENSYKGQATQLCASEMSRTGKSTKEESRLVVALG